LRRRRPEEKVQEWEKGPATPSSGRASPTAKEKKEGEEGEMEKANEEEDG
jgi:hypothetical protein